MADRIPAAENKTILLAFSRALGREAHVLVEHPDLLWQQMYNRLQWEGEETSQILAPELARRSAPGVRPWLWVRTPFRESEALVRTLAEHKGSIKVCKFSNNGKYIISASKDTTLRIWDADTGKCLHILEGHTQNVTKFIFSPDGSMVLSCSDDGTLRLWNIASGMCIQTLTGHPQPVQDCAFSPDGRFIASSSGDAFSSYQTWGDNSVRVWETANGGLSRQLEGHSDLVTRCAFTPDGKRIITASNDGTLRIWNAESGVCARILKSTDGKFKKISFSEDGNFIVTTVGSYHKEETLQIWETSTGTCLYSLKGHTAHIQGCAFSPDGSLVISYSGDHSRLYESTENELRVWDLIKGVCLYVLKGHSSAINYSSFSRDGQLIVSASEDKTIRIWDVTSEKCLHVLEGHTEGVRWFRFSRDGSKILTISPDRCPRLWDISSGKCEQVLEGHPEGITAVDFSPDNRYIVSADCGGEIKLWHQEIEQTPEVHDDQTFWGRASLVSKDARLIFSKPDGKILRVMDVSSGQCVQTLQGFETDTFNNCVSSPDGQRFASYKYPDFQVWDITNSERVCSFEIKEHKKVALSPNGCLLVISTRSHCLDIFSIEKGKYLKHLSGHESELTSFAFSPDGGKIISSSWDKTLIFWDIAGGKRLLTFKGHTGKVELCAFTPDGNSVLSSSEDHTIRIWDVMSGECLHILRDKADGVPIFSISPDGKWIVSNSGDNTLMVWSIADGECLRVLGTHSKEILAHAISPDGQWIASAGYDLALRLWSVENYQSATQLFLPRYSHGISFHPSKPLLVSWEQRGATCRIEMKGLGYGPIILTAIEKVNGLMIRCPACQQHHLIEQTQLGNEMTCPTSGCGLRLKINPFVIHLA